MTIFVDASALIAIITEEREALGLTEALGQDQTRLCSAISVWETVAGICRSYAFSVPAAQTRVKLFLEALELDFVPVGEPEFQVAAEAYAKFGKGRHPAGLNMGDCYAYACAQTNQAKLLFIGSDFVKTDIESAI